jgi:Ca2+-binding EF-hand superfamily protein
MGPSYDACKGCYSSSTAQATKGTKTDKEAKSKKRSNRDEFFKSIAKGDGNDKSISLGDFDNFVQSEIKRTGAKKTTAPVKEIFKAFDVNSDGFIDRSEMDNESVKHGLVKD